MLLINDNVRKILEGNFLGDQGMSPDGKRPGVFLSAGCGKKGKVSGFFAGSGEQFDVYSERFEPGPEGLKMLLREDLCRSHERGIVACLDR